MNSPDPATEAAAPSQRSSVGLTIDELEAASGVPVRTIRFYRQSGLIESPRRVGRQAFYREDQVARLRLIAALRKRGLALDAVSKILADPAGEHRSFRSLLQIREELLEPWIDDAPVVLDEAAVAATIGTDHPVVFDELVRYGIIERAEGPGRFVVTSPARLELTSELMTAGVDADVAVAAWAAMVNRITGLGDELIALFVEHAEYGFPGASTPDAASIALGQLRPIALKAIQLAFAHEIERAIETYLDRTAEPARTTEPGPDS